MGREEGVGVFFWSSASEVSRLGRVRGGVGDRGGGGRVEGLLTGVGNNSTAVARMRQ